MKFSTLKASTLALAIAGCLLFGTTETKAESVFSTTAVGGLSLSLEDIVNTQEDETQVTDEDPLAAGATDVKEVTEIPEVKEETTTDKAKEQTEEVAAEEEPSKYEGIAVAKVTKYLNIRKSPSEDSEVIGKLYKGAAGTILKTKKSGWTKIESGSVTGWVKSEYIVTGDDVEEYANTVCKKVATVTAQTLKVREKATQDSKVVTLIPEGETYSVLKEKKAWVAIKVEDGVKGYVSKEYVELDFDFDEAVSIEEERQAEEEAARALEEQQQQAQEAQQDEETTSSNTTESNTSESTSTSTSNDSSSSSSSASTSESSEQSSSSSSTSATRQSIVNFALQFVGNPYVYGGTSLTNGADCSGFTQSVYKNFGISISRTSRDQATNGTAVSLSNVQPGDLIFYKNGSTIGHVALYIGNGQVVHASSPTSGIKVSNMYYRTPYCARNILG